MSGIAVLSRPVAVIERCDVHRARGVDLGRNFYPPALRWTFHSPCRGLHSTGWRTGEDSRRQRNARQLARTCILAALPMTGGGGSICTPRLLRRNSLNGRVGGRHVPRIDPVCRNREEAGGDDRDQHDEE